MIAVSVFGLETHDDDVFRAYQLATRHMFAGSQRILRCRGVCARKEQRLSHQRHGGGRSFRRALVAKNGRERRGLSRILPAWHHHGIARAWLGWRTDRFSVAGASFASSWNARIGAALHLLRDGLPGFSSLHIVVGEQVPKTLAIREPV